MKRVKNVVIGFLFLLLFGNLNGQNLIDTIEVSTALIPMKSYETGRNISVLSSEEIDKQIFSSIDDLLQYIPSIEVQTRNAFGSQGDITMRGSTFTQVLVLVNGMKLNDPLTGHFNNYIPVSPGEIDRIEVLRGAASAMYGADAVGGVINIITKTFGPASRSVTGEINYGQNELITTNHAITFREENYYINAGLNINKSEGELVPVKYLETDTLDAYNNYFDNRNYGIAFGYRFNNKWDLRLRSSFDQRDFSARYFYTNSSFDLSTEKTSNNFSQVELNHLGNNCSTKLQLAHRSGSDVFVFNPNFPSTNTHTTSFSNLQLNHLKELNDWLSINLGIQYDQRSVESTDRGDHDDDHKAAHLTALINPFAALNITYSLRYDQDKNYGSEITPQLNIGYGLGKLKWRAAAGKSIRAADYTERFVSFNLENLSPGRSLGNPDLEAERSWSQEIGLDYFVNNNLALRATAFSRQSTNLVDYISTNASDIPNNTNLLENENYFYAQNISEVSTNGIELAATYKKTFSERSDFVLDLSYNYLHTNSDEEIISVYISRHARHLVSTKLNYNRDKFHWNLNGLFKEREQRTTAALGETVNGKYFVMNSMVQFDLHQNWALQFKCFNILDNQNQDILGAALPGRWMLGGIKYQIK